MDRELADVVDVQLSFLEGELPTCWPNQDALPNRLEGGQAIIEVANIEAKRRVRLNEECCEGGLEVGWNILAVLAPRYLNPGNVPA
jgi:hypothetical protein